MILNITTTRNPATDLSYLLHKHPDKFQTVDLSVGVAHVFYPDADAERTTASLLLDIDPIDMVRNVRNLSGDFALGQYVNDRPYVASSFMSAAIAKAFSSALNGKCKDKPELVDEKLPFEIVLAALPAPKGGGLLIRKFFEPLGYLVALERQILDPKFPEWGESKYYTLKLTHSGITLKDLLSHLYVLIPTLDNDKHYFVSEQEIEKLLQKGEGWLAEHPEKEQIAQRYLINLQSLSRRALEQLSEETEERSSEMLILENSEVEQKRESLHEMRLKTVTEKLVETGATHVLDLGCGEGKLIRELLKHKQFEKIAGMDVSYDALLKVKERLHYDEMRPKNRERIELFQGSLTYRDRRLEGYDAAAVVEVIEHLDLNRLKAFERVLFEFAQPKTVILTTPNREYNVMWEKLDTDKMRHTDHRFEWTRQEFEDWANEVGSKYQYTVETFPLGEEVENIGAPSQMAIFKYGN